MLSNLSIFSSSAIFAWLAEDVERAKALGAIHWQAYWPTLLLLVLGVTAVVFAVKYKPVFKFGLLSIGTLLILRAVLFFTPFVWYVFFKIYLPEDVGFKEKSVIAYNIDNYFRRVETTDFMVIGSSQIRMFKELSQEDRSFAMYSFGGMMPVEYALYENLIADKKPSNIILYLSEFDLARKPALSAIELDPLPGDKVHWLYKSLTKLFDSATAISALKHMAVGRIIPEYQSGYLFRPITARWFGDANPNVVKSKSADDWAIVQALSLREKLNEKYLAINAPLIEEFIEYCLSRGARIYIFEGRYHPAAYDERLLGLRQQSRDILANIASRHQGVEFIPIEDLPPLSGENFVDGYHLSDETSHWFSRVLYDKVKHGEKPAPLDVH